MSGARRTVLVAPERLDGWVRRFAERHGDVTTARHDGVVVRTAVDGAVAEHDDSLPPGDLGVLLVRRGGWSVGLVLAGRLVAHKSGTRYVQGGTKAGGWSQQRYARRRANQADALVADCAAHADRVLVAFSGADPVPLVGGGDRLLVAAVVDALRVPVRLAPRHLDVPDPRHRVLVDAVASALAVEVRLNDLA